MRLHGVKRQRDNWNEDAFADTRTSDNIEIRSDTSISLYSTPELFFFSVTNLRNLAPSYPQLGVYFLFFHPPAPDSEFRLRLSNLPTIVTLSTSTPLFYSSLHLSPSSVFKKYNTVDRC